MLALFSIHPEQIPQLCSALPPDQQVVAVKDWNHLERAIPAVECSVIHFDQLHSSSTLSKLSALKARHPRHPVVLVTRWNLENARHLKDISVEEVIWFREIEQDLRPAVERARALDSNYVRCLAGPFQDAEHLPTTLRGALVDACRSDQPVHSINQLAASAGSTRGTLWYQWKKAVGPSSTLRLQDFLHWLLLLRVIGRKTPDRTWAEVAEEVGVHAHTLWRYGKQLTGCTLPELAKDPLEVTRLFRKQVLEFLLDGEGLNIL